MNDKGYILQLEKQYKNYLKQVIADLPFEIIELRGGKNRPETTRQLAEDIKQFQQFEKREGKSKGWTISWEEWNSKKLGRQKWPSSIFIENEEDFLYLIGKESETKEFKHQLKELLAWRKEIRLFLLERPQYVLQNKSVWNDLCLVVDYLLANDVSNHYIRSIPVPVHTKFIEQNKSLIFDLYKHFSQNSLSEDVASLETVLGLKEKQHLYTLRWLDDELSLKYMHGHEVFGLSTVGLQNVKWEIDELWLVENETNLYILPQRKNALVIFSKGYAFRKLFDIPLFNGTKLFYWGDLDEDGFNMLNTFKKHYSHAISVCMDLQTVMFHQSEMLKQPANYKISFLEYLSKEENEAFQILYDANGRIEQEKLNQEFLSAIISKL